jgi:hypothetical protein
MADAHQEPDAHMDTFAWFQFPPSIAVDPVYAAKSGADTEWTTVFAHELGHHVLSPSTRIISLKLTQQMARAISATASSPLPGIRSFAATFSNLWSDMLINERVAEMQRREEPTVEPGMIRLWRRLRRRDVDRIMWIVLRAYEELWGLRPNSLCDATPPPAPPRRRAKEAITRVRAARRGAADALEQATADVAAAERDYEALLRPDPFLDASILARTVRTFGADPIRGALRFGMLMAPYLFEGGPASSDVTGVACAGDQTTGTPSSRELAEVMRDPRLREAPLHPVLADAVAAGTVTAPEAPTEASARPGNQGYGLAETLALYEGVERAAVLEAWYVSAARPWIRPYRQIADAPPPSGDDLVGALELWEIGDALEEIDWTASLAGGQLIPGVTSRRRALLPDPVPPAEEPVTLDLYIDSSGSMPSPDTESPALLAGVILVLSVLSGGGRVRVTSFASPGQVAGTPRFSRNTSEAVAAVLTYFGGGTTFPLDLLGERYRASTARRGERRHLVVLSDDGSASLFGYGQERYAHVADEVRALLDTATLVLLDPRHTMESTALRHGYRVNYLDSLADAPAACAALARRLIDPRSTRG